ncbi:hypothetical protein [Enterococcus sp. AZ101]|uniref:hypothetical protein n=1 Tax=Enterococcus sp. AZ101 TaxID=2774742 RepID=UPI003D27B6F4
MTEDRSTFGSENIVPQQFDTLLKKPKKGKSIDINGEFDFSSDVLTKTVASPAAVQKTNESSSKRGRPVTIKDPRYKVNRPKMISSALESKLSVLQDYVEEFQDITGRITFEKYIDTLAEFYIKQKLGIAKEEHLRFEINEAFEQLEKK